MVLYLKVDTLQGESLAKISIYPRNPIEETLTHSLNTLPINSLADSDK